MTGIEILSFGQRLFGRLKCSGFSDKVDTTDRSCEGIWWIKLSKGRFHCPLLWTR